MKKMNLKKLLCLTAAVLLLAGALVVPTGASSAYQTYTYSIGGTALYSPDAYTATKAVGASESPCCRRTPPRTARWAS